ncbi:uncharacterized protein M421DRAFT_3089 [Didymella exigua CBS 183.55]|uniref:Uncharacterized protein n=1 Tax=Didymella exigua CBS 183.55 TaxID=1150837 RepID=A0A6A5RZV9_9PLEO|nr:uncharacterized protein M421DRAFT_3089 [Didymella exigua CBS 183.55]KAF1930797.1 hypothetical protein M421DRAFT_3089 [Didymella exigua CBS 183.55]
MWPVIEALSSSRIFWGDQRSSEGTNPFFWGNHLKFDVDRDPFESSQNRLRTVLQLYVLGADNPVTVVEDPEDEEDSDNTNDEPSPLYSPKAIKARAQRPIDLLPPIFPTDAPETFVLHHHNLLRTTSSSQTKLNCHLCPDPDQYMKEILDDGTEEINFLYYEYLAEFEKTQLRAFFLEETQRICPD